MSIDWKLAITQMAVVKSKIFEADTRKLWPYNFPKVAASEEMIEQFNGRIRRELPLDYLDFLRTANGWNGFFQNNDLMGTDDFSDNRYVSIISQEFLELEEVYINGVAKEDLLPVAVNLTDRDLFFMILTNNEKFGNVIWFAGEEIDRFDSFPVFFLSMIAYNERELRRLKGLPV